jgi:hypothetical protein
VLLLDSPLDPALELPPEGLLESLLLELFSPLPALDAELSLALPPVLLSVLAGALAGALSDFADAA